MNEYEGNRFNLPLMGKTEIGDYLMAFKENKLYGILGAILVAILVPLLSTIFMRRKKPKQRGVEAEVGGEPGYAIRNARTTELLEVPWEGATTMAALFEQSCKKHSQLRCLGTRKIVGKEFITDSSGRKFEKLHLGEYQWETYGEIFDRARNFASGLVKLGHDMDTRAAIFSESRPEWFISFQGCFRQNITVVTIYASLGEEALIHSLNETQVSTLICDSKQLKRLPVVISRLQTIKNIIYFEDGDTVVDPNLFKDMSNWTVSSFSEVEKLGKYNSVRPQLPIKTDIAVIMYTSGSTGLPKGVMMTHRNLVACAAAVVTVIPKLGSNDVYLAYLPLAHVFELEAEIVMFCAGVSIGYGSTLTLTDTSNKIKKGTMGDASVLKPTLMAAVPAILDRVRDGVLKKVGEKGGLAKKLFDIAYKRRVAALEGSWFGAWGLEALLWDLIIFKKIRSVLGGDIRFMLCGGAPLYGDTQRFVNICMGAPVVQGYGLTETCAGAAFSEFDDISVGRVGPPLPCCFVKLVSWDEGGYLTSDKPMPRGEVVVGGGCVTDGYFNNNAKTNEVYKVAFNSPVGSCLEAQVQENQSKLRALETMVNRLQSDIDVKDDEVLLCKKKLNEIELFNLKCSKKLSNNLKSNSSSTEFLLTIRVFDSMLRDTWKSLRDFTQLLIALMKKAGWDLDLAANSVHSNVDYAKKGHNKYAFLSYVCLAMFQGFDVRDFGLEGSEIVCNGDGLNKGENNCLKQLIEHVSGNPMEILNRNPRCDFSRFCENKYEKIIHPTMESSIFRNFDRKEVVLDSWRSLSVFYESFVKMASSVWLLHKLAHSFNPVIEIFQVERGVDFSLVYMEDVTKTVIFLGKSRPKVALTVVPGFRIGRTVIQSQVYLTGLKCTE